MRYPAIEKLAYSHVLASRKLRPYFQAHPIIVYTDQLLRQVLPKPEVVGRLFKWAVELSQFDIQYQPRTAIKDQALADFVTEFKEPYVPEPTCDEATAELDIPTWQLYVDGSSNDQHSGAGIILVSPKGHKFHSAVKFGFTASNNEAEYEALLAGLRLARTVQARAITVFSDSLLMVNQILGEYQA